MEKVILKNQTKLLCKIHLNLIRVGKSLLENIIVIRELQVFSQQQHCLGEDKLLRNF
jgi:hypothetical protein